MAVNRKKFSNYAIGLGLVAASYGAYTLLTAPVAKVGLFGIPEAAWAGSSIALGLVLVLMNIAVRNSK